MERAIACIISTIIFLLGYYMKKYPDNGVIVFRFSKIEGDHAAEKRMNSHCGPLLALAGMAGLAGCLFDSKFAIEWSLIPLIVVAAYSIAFSFYHFIRRPQR